MATKDSYPIHPAAEIFPLLKDTDAEGWSEFLDDMKEHGQQEAIALYKDQVLDGRNRQLACQTLGIKPKFLVVAPLDPVQYVISRNLHRRHLTASQRGLAAARAKPLFEEQAALRKAEGQAKGGKSTAAGKAISASGKHLPQAGEASQENLDEINVKLAEASGGKAVEQAGEAFGVSSETVRKADLVIKKGSAALQKAADSGEVSVNAASKLAELPKDEQKKALADLAAGKTPKALKPKKKGGKKEPKSGSVIATHAELKNLLGKFTRLVDAVDKKHPGGKFSRDIHVKLDAIHNLIDDWKKSPKPE